MLRPSFCLAFALALAGASAQQPAPAVLRAQVPNRGLANGEPFALGERPCLAAQLGGRAFLIWDRTDYLPVANDAKAADLWLRQHSKELGHGAFTPAFARAINWRQHPVLVFTLEHNGTRLHDAEIWVCFDDGGCVGIVNRVPLGLAVAPPVPDAAAPNAILEPCYYVRREEGQPDRLIVAGQRRSNTATHTIVEFLDGDTAFARELSQRETATPDSAATFTAFSVGGFPDQLAADSRGVIWCSDPTGNRLIEMDPQTGAVTSHSTSPWRQPDGLSVDQKDRVWTGLYTAGDGLGVFDRSTNTFTRYPVPAGGANLAIPTWHHSGSVFVTEHPPSRLHEFELATSTWKPSIQLPTGGWPVEAYFDTSNGDMFVTLYSTNQIAIIRNSALASAPPTPVQSGPSFCAALNGKVWFSYWTSSQLGELDVASGVFTTHNMPVSGQGGPIDIGPNGHVYLGTRATGYILEFDPKTGITTPHAIPSPNWQLKDGLTVAPDGTVWFTSSSNGQIVRLTLP